MTKEQIKQWLINDGQVPDGCENNEYWGHWYDVINRMLQGQSLHIDSVSKCQHPYKKVISGDEGMWCTECNKYIDTF
jgi:hypothetical protein